MQKNLTGITEKVLVTPVCEVPEYISSFFDVVHQVKETKHGYIAQQIDKIDAYKYTTQPYILYSDSDCIYTKPYNALDVIYQNRVKLYVTPYSALSGNVMHWQTITEAAIGAKPTVEYMRCFPIMHIREVSEEVANNERVRNYMTRIKDNSFSEFNCLGLHASIAHPTRYLFLNTLIDFPELTAKQYWSWGGITPEILKELEEI
jgi:hypothetical protein